MDPGFGPDEWLGVLVVSFDDEGIDMLAELRDGSERSVVQHVAQAREWYTRPPWIRA
jgi:hypothetical protein